MKILFHLCHPYHWVRAIKFVHVQHGCLMDRIWMKMNAMVRLSFYLCTNTMFFPYGFPIHLQGSKCFCDFFNICLEFIESFLESFNSLYYLFHSHNLRPGIIHTLAVVKFWAYLRVIWLERGQAQESSDVGHLKLCHEKFGTVWKPMAYRRMVPLWSSRHPKSYGLGLLQASLDGPKYFFLTSKGVLLPGN